MDKVTLLSWDVDPYVFQGTTALKCLPAPYVFQGPTALKCLPTLYVFQGPTALKCYQKLALGSKVYSGIR